jgi:dienelactone hydrolase
MRRLVPLAAVALLVGCGGSHAVQPRLTISSRTALVDALPRVVLSGARPSTRTIVRATSKDLTGQPFAAGRAVRTNEDGVAPVPLSTLLSSMHPPGADPGYGDIVPWAGQFVTVSADGLSVRFRLLIRAPNVAERDLRPDSDGLYGDFFHAPSSTRKPAVLLFGGSEGGLSTAEEGALLASRGVPTLALAYFGEPGLPATLANVPLEYFAKGLRWLARQPGVDPRRLAVDGVSRGSEAALLLGVEYPQLVHAVVALVPGNVVLCGYPQCGEPAWTLHGKPLPYQTSFGPVGPHPIPVERIRAPLFLVCGGGDRVWPSCSMAHAIEERRHGRGVTLLSYPDAGHGVGYPVPNVPIRSLETDGIEPLANARARVAVWPRLLSFLRSP